MELKDMELKDMELKDTELKDTELIDMELKDEEFENKEHKDKELKRNQDNIDFLEEKDSKNTRLEALSEIIVLAVLLVALAVLGYNRFFGSKNTLAFIPVENTAADITNTKETEDKEDKANSEDTENTNTDTITQKEDEIALTPTNSITPTPIPDNSGRVFLDELPQTYVAGKLQKSGEFEGQLAEVYGYFDLYNMGAVNEVVRLERFLPISKSLEGSNDFYYYGEKELTGLPHGKGFAVYANNTFYFGDWKWGKRDGSGLWMRIFPDNNGTVNGIKGVISYSYNGEFLNDYPHGQGQEHFDYDNPVVPYGDSIVLQNVIGGFSRGYYNGDVLIYMAQGNTDFKGYQGSCSIGTFNYLYEGENSKKRTILKYIEGDDTITIYPQDNSNFGIAGLK